MSDMRRGRSFFAIIGAACALVKAHADAGFATAERSKKKR